jgi:predicted regulator of Ras-like GTPase activity (Roadblock/LC7/MglB family)
VDVARALDDLISVSSQLEGAVIVDAGGAPVASTFAGGRGEEVAREALELLAAADASAAAGGRAELAEVVAHLADGAVFVVRAGGRVVAGVTGADPAVGLVLYDLKTCLRLAEEAPRPAPRRRARAKSAPGRGGTATDGRRKPRRKKDGGA